MAHRLDVCWRQPLIRSVHCVSIDLSPERSGAIVYPAARLRKLSGSDMSKGTRFQLCMAMSVAGYHEFVQTRRPVPFIADDIMETFDDDRAKETFPLFGEVANVGQVIYFTHHQHLCEIAMTTCSSVRIHQL